jgi:hypothetical protein
MAETPMRFIRIPNERWDKADQRARRENTNRSALINLWLDKYANEDSEMSLTEELHWLVGRLNDVCARITGPPLPH